MRTVRNILSEFALSPKSKLLYIILYIVLENLILKFKNFETICSMLIVFPAHCHSLNFTEHITTQPPLTTVSRIFSTHSFIARNGFTVLIAVDLSSFYFKLFVFFAQVVTAR